MFTNNHIRQIKLSENNHVGYFDYGQGKPIIMLHGFPDTAKTFCHQAKAFNKAGYRVICPYLPGYEYTSSPSNGYFGLYDIAQILSQFIDKIIPHQEAVILGHDWGASILRLIQNFHHRKKTKYVIKGLVFVAVPITRKMQALLNHQYFPGFKQLYMSRYILFFQLQHSIKKIQKNELTYIKKLWQCWAPGIEENNPQMLDAVHLLSRNNNLANAIHYYRYNANLLSRYNKCIPRENRLNNQMGSLIEELPALTLRGLEDGCLSRHLFEGCNDFFPHTATRFVEIEKAGHFVHYENPSAFNQTVFDFFDAIKY